MIGINITVILEATYQEARSESKDLTAARAAVESQLGIHWDIRQKQQEKRQEKQTYTPGHEHGKMDLRAELQQCKAEAERSLEAQDVRQDKPWAYLMMNRNASGRGRVFLGLSLRANLLCRPLVHMMHIIMKQNKRGMAIGGHTSQAVKKVPMIGTFC